MKILLLVIAVANGRFYHETPMYAVEYPTEEACAKVAATYPTKGVNFEKAVCIPKLSMEKK